MDDTPEASSSFALFAFDEIDLIQINSGFFSNRKYDFEVLCIDKKPSGLGQSECVL